MSYLAPNGNRLVGRHTMAPSAVSLAGGTPARATALLAEKLIHCALIVERAMDRYAAGGLTSLRQVLSAFQRAIIANALNSPRRPILTAILWLICSTTPARRAFSAS